MSNIQLLDLTGANEVRLSQNKRLPFRSHWCLASSTGKAALLGVALWCLVAGWPAGATDGPDPICQKGEPVTMAELAKRTTDGVAAIEVKDYAPGHYPGPMIPSPPHADFNAGKAVVVFWKDPSQRFVFSHEASYCPLLELTNGTAMCNQFFEGNFGDAELFNNGGRRERNSFVEIIQRGPQRVWVRWTYFCVSQNENDTKPRLRGTEDYFAYPNGLVLRRATYESLMPNEASGYSTQPVELFGVLPVGSVFKDLFSRDAEHGDYGVLAALDLYSDRRYDIYWDEKGGVRRRGDDATLVKIGQSAGCALVLPFREKLLFAVLGKASGFPSENNRIVDHCTPGSQGCGWGQGLWDHWPIGWQGSQGHSWAPGSPYAYHYGSIGQFFVPDGKPFDFKRDYDAYCKDMEFNRWTERHVFYVLLGSASDWDAVRRIGRSWLDQGNCARPESIAKLK